ncbi:MAG TPA: hypothetical protein VHV78_10900 [Gemmatimonadaceae bacterium]|nr:hypothetical protein [Gemmatimonadaceae bacterium]
MPPPRAHYRPPDHSKGDESTIGGYAAVHDRPAAFEGCDGFSYSVEMVVENTGDAVAPWAAFFLFIKWARVGAQTPEGHLETDYLARGASEAAARSAIGETPLPRVKALLDDLVAARNDGKPERKWWDAMRDEDDGGSDGGKDGGDRGGSS